MISLTDIAAEKASNAIASRENTIGLRIGVKTYLEGMQLDYQKKGLNEGFEFINPNESARCGCGESFTV